MAGLAGLIETFDALQGSIGGQADRFVQQQNTVDLSTRVHCHHVLVGTQDWRWSDQLVPTFLDKYSRRHVKPFCESTNLLDIQFSPPLQDLRNNLC